MKTTSPVILDTDVSANPVSYQRYRASDVMYDVLGSPMINCQVFPVPSILTQNLVLEHSVGVLTPVVGANAIVLYMLDTCAASLPESK